MSFLDRLQQAAQKAGKQASAFGQDVGRMVGEGAQDVLSGFSLEKECQKAAKILESFLANPDHPEAVLQRAKGLAVFTVLKAGFVWSGKAGSGVVIARLPDGSWSAPSCIATGGVGFGFQIGADISEFVVVLNSDDAVKAFCTAGNLTVGGNVSATAGPIGTGAAVNTALLKPAPLFTYSKSKGLFAGVSLEGTALIERKDANAAFCVYHDSTVLTHTDGIQIPTVDLLTGKIPAPEAASPLYSVVEAAEQVDESGVPSQSFVPAAAPAPTANEAPIFDSTSH